MSEPEMPYTVSVRMVFCSQTEDGTDRREAVAVAVAVTARANGCWMIGMVSMSQVDRVPVCRARPMSVFLSLRIRRTNQTGPRIRAAESKVVAIKVKPTKRQQARISGHREGESETHTPMVMQRQMQVS